MQHRRHAQNPRRRWRHSIAAPYADLLDIFRRYPPDTTIVTGFVEKAEPDILYSSAAVLRAGVILGVSRKLFPIEPLFTAGEELPTYDLNGWSFGVVICYDGNLVEPARLLALAGARLLVCAP